MPSPRRVRKIVIGTLIAVAAAVSVAGVAGADEPSTSLPTSMTWADGSPYSHLLDQVGD